MLSKAVNIYQGGANWLDGFLNFQPLLTSLSNILDDYRPAIHLIAFVLLVVSAIHGFLQPDSRRFFQTLAQSIILTALICQTPVIIQWFQAAATAFANLPQARTIRVGNATIDFKPGETPLIKSIENVLAQKANPQKNSQSSSQESSLFGWNVSGMISAVKAWAWEVLFGIYLLILLLSKMIILLMTFIQQLIIIGFKMYTPLGIAEYALKSLKGKATNFFLTFVGVLCWPIGWSIVNSVTLAILQMIPAPIDNDAPSVIFSNVMVVPVLIWVFVGHVVTPIYVQKVVVHGGSVIQGFIGSTLATVGLASAGANTTFLQGIAKSIHGKEKDDPNRGESERSGSRRSSSRNGVNPVMGTARRIATGPRESGSQASSVASGNHSLRHPLAKPFSFAAGATTRAGVMAGFIGHAVAQGSGSRSVAESDAVAAVAPLGSYDRSIKAPPPRSNRSSDRARTYLR
jgi:hypothetical protein